MNLATVVAKPFRFASITGNASGTYLSVNYGQQPFVASNVTYDQDAGTVEIGVDTYNTLFESTSDSLARMKLSYSRAGDYQMIKSLEAAFREYKNQVESRKTSILSARESARTKLYALGLSIDEVDALVASL